MTTKLRRAYRRRSVLHRKRRNRRRANLGRSKTAWCSTWRGPTRVNWISTWAVWEIKISVTFIIRTRQQWRPSCSCRRIRVPRRSLRWILSRVRQIWLTLTHLSRKTWVTMREWLRVRKASWTIKTNSMLCHATLNQRRVKICLAIITQTSRECRVVRWMRSLRTTISRSQSLSWDRCKWTSKNLRQCRKDSSISKHCLARCATSSARATQTKRRRRSEIKSQMRINLLKIAAMTLPSPAKARTTTRRIWIINTRSKCYWGFRTRRRSFVMHTRRSSACKYRIRRSGGWPLEVPMMSHTTAASSRCSSCSPTIIPRYHLLYASLTPSRSRATSRVPRRERRPTWSRNCSSVYHGDRALASVTYVSTWWKLWRAIPTENTSRKLTCRQSMRSLLFHLNFQR